MLSLEQAYQKVMASWRGRVSEETMIADLKTLELAGLDAAETSYARNYVGAHENDSVAISFRHLRARIEALGNESSGNLEWSRHGQSSGGGRRGYDRLAGKRLPVMEKENASATKAEDDGSHWKRLGVKRGMNW